MRLAFATGPSANGDAPYAERFLHDFELRNCYDRFYHEGSESRGVNTRFLLSGHAFTVVADGRRPIWRTTNAGCWANSAISISCCSSSGISTRRRC